MKPYVSRVHRFAGWIAAAAVASALAGGCRRNEDLTRDFGGPCSTDLDCTMHCLPRPTWPDGFCTRPCTVDVNCPVTSACALSVCLFSCFDDRDCAFLGDGWGCRSLAAKLVCAPSNLPDAGAQDAP